MNELKKDDIVEVLRYKRVDGVFQEHWVSCIVTSVEHPYGFDVKPLKGAFNEAGQDALALPFSEKGRMWR
jgi:hypothetical protein